MPEEIVVITLISIVGVFAFAWIAIGHCAAIVRAWIDTALKRDMVARGYSAQEIIAVVGADRKCGSDVPPAKPIRQPAYQ